MEKQSAQLGRAYKELREAGRKLDRHLNAVVRRSRLERVGLEALHAVLLLAIFTFGFGKVEESVCAWVPRIAGMEKLSEHNCLIVWFVISVALFGLERWFFGPPIDRWLDRRAYNSTSREMRYFSERVRLEYAIAIIDHAISTEYDRLQKYGLL